MKFKRVHGVHAGLVRGRVVKASLVASGVVDALREALRDVLKTRVGFRRVRVYLGVVDDDLGLLAKRLHRDELLAKRLHRDDLRGRDVQQR